ncbi:hypothetical protein H4217_000546 [Coemansia sp. RSA 1939]|nr:hypothetical protein H4217_000546 [Coemansia sp. RSA 1939]
MSMIDPCPRFSPYCKNPPPALPAGVSWDNANIMAPIDPSSDVICKSNTPWPEPVATWTAGQPVTVEFKKGGTAHNGGHAQFSVSYDNGKTFAVVYEVLEHAFYNKNTYSDTPEVLKYTFTLPTDLPSSEKAVFAWSWVSPKADGSTSFYMNCADVEIKGSSSTSYTGRKTVIADVKGYPTIAASDSGFTWGLDYYTNAPNVTVIAMLCKSIVFSALALFASVSANMSMIDPCPRFSPYCKNPPPALPAGVSWDNTNIMAPIDPSSDVICKSNTPWPEPVATWTAGQPVTVEFAKGGTAHNGGHAQFSVSYDNGKTFAVVYKVLEHAFFNKNAYSDTPKILKYTFPLPTDLPSSDKVVFAWSWVSRKPDGNTSSYMNCADVEIKGSSSTSYTGRKTVIADVKGYPTIAASDSGFTWGLDYYTNAPNVTVSASNAAGKSLNIETNKMQDVC